jgi:hypothetical protein
VGSETTSREDRVAAGQAVFECTFQAKNSSVSSAYTGISTSDAQPR